MSGHRWTLTRVVAWCPAGSLTKTGPFRSTRRVSDGDGADAEQALSDAQFVVVEGQRAAVHPRAAAGLLPQRELADGHRAVDGFAHVVDRQRGDRARGQRLHLDTRAVDGVDLRLDLDVAVLDPEVHEH